ncbi:ABC transporter [Streptomyces spiroverticillatus]|uniref:ABC transporter n=1 Tax=Streptomyces finlayi TaxID=67296 RepID=A0A918X5G7_9ACTN|nr:FtsX-like permease family protein [Streptomyces finlayi]GHA49183.1 ABC transporter [Streptomyces spiroverticillatus]GHD13684.1 ABC transporter [Streptomyces finlayi]
MFRTALRNVLAHRARLLMTMLAVALGAAFVCGTLVFTATVSAQLTRASQQDFAHVDVAVRPGADAALAASVPTLSTASLEALRRLPEVARVTGVVSGFTAVAGKDGRPAERGGPTLGTNHDVQAGSGASDPRHTFTAGRPPSGRGEIALDEGTATRTGYRVGDTARISVDGPGLRVRITGLFTTDDGPVNAGGTLVLYDTATAQRHFTAPGRFTELDVEAAPGVSQEDLETKVRKVLPRDAQTLTGSLLAHDQRVHIEAATASLRTTLLAFAAVALFVSCFLIANTFTMLVAQRSREIALLRALGAQRRQVTRQVLTEAGLVGLVASLAGLALGVGIAAALGPFVASAGSLPLGANGPLDVPWYALSVPVVTGVTTTVLASWLPSRRAATVPPVAVMTQVFAPVGTRQKALRTAVGALVAALGVAAVLGSLGLTRTEDGILLMTLGAMAVTAGCVVLLPVLVRPAVALARPLWSTARSVRELAARNCLRSPRRTAATASALVIGLGLVTSLTMVGAGGQKAADAQAAAVLKADYVVSMADLSVLGPDVEPLLRTAPGVTRIGALHDAQAEIGGAHRFLTSAAASTVRDQLRLRFTSGSLDAFGGTRILVSGHEAKAGGWSAGTRLPVRLADGTRTEFTVAGVYESNSLVGDFIAEPASLGAAPAGPSLDKVLVTTADGSGARTARALAHALGDSPAVRIESGADLSEAAARGVTRMLGLLYGLLAMSVTVALLGIVNTLALSVTERQREIGLLRALGLDRGGVRRMVRLESLFLAVFGGLVGIALGVFLGWAGGELISADLPGYTHELPVGRLLFFLALAALAGVVASLWPARRAARTDILTAVGAE